MIEFNNINKANNYLSPQIIEHKKPTTYAHRKSDPVFTCKCGGFKPDNKTSTPVISWRSDLLVDKTTDLSQVTDKRFHKMLYRLSGNRTHNVSGDSTDCIGSY